MATLGPNDLKQWALPAGWDAARLAQPTLADDTTYETLVNSIAAGLAIANGGLLTDPIVSSLISVTDQMALEYPTGVSNGFETHTEYSQPTAKRRDNQRMLEPVDLDRKPSWTFDFPRKARRSQVDADIASALADLRRRGSGTIIQRLFKSTLYRSRFCG